LEYLNIGSNIEWGIKKAKINIFIVLFFILLYRKRQENSTDIRVLIFLSTVNHVT